MERTYRITKIPKLKESLEGTLYLHPDIVLYFKNDVWIANNYRTGAKYEIRLPANFDMILQELAKGIHKDEAIKLLHDHGFPFSVIEELDACGLLW